MRTLEQLRDNIRGELIFPGEPGYNDARSVWNGMIDRRPAAVVRAADAADVIASVDFASETGIPISAKGGGHGVSGKAVRDDGLLVDLVHLNAVQVDEKERTARVGGGATLGDVDRETQAFGLAVPAGIVSETGVAGLTLGGGIGYQARKSGLTIDNLIEADIVIADGSLVTASADNHTDLFWAIRGGGGNFGIVTSFLYRLHELGPDVMTSLSYFDIAETADVLRFYREFMHGAANGCAVYCLFANVPPADHFPAERRGMPAVILHACYAGPVEEGRKALTPLRQFGAPFFRAFDTMKFTDLQKAFDPAVPKGMRAYWKGLNLEEIEDELVNVFADRLMTIPGPMSLIGFEPLGGKVAEVDPSATAYAFRNARFSLGIWSGWDEPAMDEANIEWTRSLYRDLEGFTSGGVYVNYLDRDEQERTRSALGANFSRLLEIKQKYDPGNMFIGNLKID
ncbi:MAG TPA: FAD-dependent oxidoreductase [Aridibacter sp.]|nr:FAD-dependent oxidoreductase [Aridibacter sp.]